MPRGAVRAGGVESDRGEAARGSDLLCEPPAGERLRCEGTEGAEQRRRRRERTQRETLAVHLLLDAAEHRRADAERRELDPQRLDGLHTSGEFLVGDVEMLTERTAKGSDAAHEAARAYATFEEYRRRLSQMRGGDVLDGDLPRDPEFLSYSLAATCLLTMAERQALLEADTPLDRLVMLRFALREEMRAMRAIPSLPATEVARTSWSPN